MNRPFLLFSCLLLTSYFVLHTSPIALAVDSVFFEFAPESWASTRFPIAENSEDIYQVFSSSKDTTLTGFDLWADNTGEAGPVTFSIFPDDGSAPLIRTVQIPHLLALPGGYKYHVNLPTTLQLETGKTYAMKIESDLPGLAFYSADRILMLEHNKKFTSEYGSGVAKIGQTLQPFTFKFALHEPQTTSNSYNNDSQGLTATDVPTNTTTTQNVTIAITNARVVESTPTTVTFAWTTNIATNSSVAIRSQLSPINVVKSAVDPTLELEHTLTVTGLLPSANYFADIFSSQGNEIVLTTYTIGFKMPAQTVIETPTVTPVTPVAPVTPTSDTQAGVNTSATSANPTNSQTSGQNTSGSTSGLNINGIQAEPGSRSDTTSVSWPSSKKADSVKNYRIDVFDYDHNLERTINASSSANSKEITGLTTGAHSIVVYAETDKGTFEKVAPAKTVTIIRQRITLRIGVGVTVLGLIGGLLAFSIWRFKKEKTILPAEEGYNPESY